ncbi:hypothetical protein F5Y08DRAFT_145915 [Xylaria arbuscula]|nr:hypothetical protein F5Y08DRAFT_145915 [Xylaria arbuscula]
MTIKPRSRPHLQLPHTRRRRVCLPTSPTLSFTKGRRDEIRKAIKGEGKKKKKSAADFFSPPSSPMTNRMYNVLPSYNYTLPTKGSAESDAVLHHHCCGLNLDPNQKILTSSITTFFFLSPSCLYLYGHYSVLHFTACSRHTTQDTCSIDNTTLKSEVSPMRPAAEITRLDRLLPFPSPPLLFPPFLFYFTPLRSATTPPFPW